MIGSYTAPKEHGILVVFSGPSGAGKGTILKRYFEDDPPAVLSVSATTRAPRPGEVDGVHYHFISRAEFEQLIANDGVLEYNIYNGNYYGSPRGPIEEELSKGHDVILEIETNGAGHIRRMFPSALSIFVVPPSFEELKKRLIGRGTESPEEISARLEKAGPRSKWRWITITSWSMMKWKPQPAAWRKLSAPPAGARNSINHLYKRC